MEQRLPFRLRFTKEERLAEQEKTTSRRPGYVPTIFEHKEGSNTYKLDKEKFLLPNDLTGAQLLFVIRKRLKMKPCEALFLICNHRMISGTDTVRNIYTRNKDPEDGFLYMAYTLENTFGR